MRAVAAVLVVGGLVVGPIGATACGGSPGAAELDDAGAASDASRAEGAAGAEPGTRDAGPEDADAGLDPDGGFATWPEALARPAAWFPMPDVGAPCESVLALDRGARLPLPTWVSCGTGCRRGSLRPLAATLLPGRAAGRWEAGQTFLGLALEAVGGVAYHVLRLDGESLGAVADRRASPAEPCGFEDRSDDPRAFQLAWRTTKLQGVVDPSGPRGVYVRGRYASSTRPLARVRLEGTLLAEVGGAAVTLLPDLYPEPGPASFRGAGVDGSAFGGLLVHARPATPDAPTGALGAYTVAGGWESFVTALPSPPRAVRVSATHVAWIGADDEATPGAARLYRAARAGPRDAFEVGPSVPKLPVRGELALGGDWVATLACESSGTDCVAFVADFASAKTWTVPPEPGAAFVRLLAVGPDELVLVERVPLPGGTFDLTLVRLRTGDLDTLALR